MTARIHATKRGVEGLFFGAGEPPGPPLRPPLAFEVLLRFCGGNLFYSGCQPRVIQNWFSSEKELFRPGGVNLRACLPKR